MAAARSAWGIDVGNRALKAVKVVRDAEGVHIVDFDVVEHENVLSNAGDNRDTLIQNALANFVQSHKIKGEAIAVGVSGQSSFARFIKLPPVEPRMVPGIVRFEAIQQIPFPLDDVEWAYHLFKDEASPDVEVGIFAMRKELVQQHLKFFTDAGINVDVVQMNPLAVYNAMYADGRLKGTSMVIDLGAENTDLIIAEGETVWLRSIPIGGNNFTEALVKSFKLRFEKAEELKRNAATSKYGRQILQAMRPIFADLVAEIQRSIGFYASVHRDSRISRVIALGGTFRLPGLQKYLQQNLQLEVQKIDRLSTTPPADAKVATAMNENLLSSVSAYGLAMQAVGGAKIDSSLLPQAIRREREWRGKTKWFAAAAAAFVAAAGLQVAMYYYSTMQYEKPEASTARDNIKNTLLDATHRSAEWKSVEGAGAAEKAVIANVMSMTADRELWQNIYNDIITSVPKYKLSSTNPAQLPARSTRLEVVVDDVHPDYRIDLGQFIPLDNNGILQYVGQVGPAGNTGGMKFTPAGSVGTTPVATDLPERHGFLITIHCMTPNSDGLGLVNRTLVAGLNEKKKAGDQPPPNDATGQPIHREYKIEKVWIPRYVQLKDDHARVELLLSRARDAAARQRENEAPAFSPTRAPGGARPYGSIPLGEIRGGRGGLAPPLIPPSRGVPIGRGVRAAGEGTNVPELMEPVDQQTGESLINDWDVTVVAAIVLDPDAPASAASGSTPTVAVPAALPAPPVVRSFHHE